MSVLSILLLNLLSFTALPDHDVVNLEWKTGSELMPKYFEVERSTDGQHFSAIGKLDGLAAGSMNKAYYYQDDISSLNGTTIYYRLKYVSADQMVEYSKTILVNIGTTQKISLWPNPFRSGFHAKIFVDQPGQGIINIFNSEGKQLKRMKYVFAKGYNVISVDDLEHAPAGYYIVEVIKGNNKSRQRILKDK